MTELNFELFITNGNSQETFILENTPVLIGYGADCNVVLGDGEHEIKAIIQKHKDFLLVKVFDANYPIDINGKKYKSAKIKNSVFIKVGEVDIVVSVEKVELDKVDLAMPPVDLPDFLDEDISVVTGSTGVTNIEANPEDLTVVSPPMLEINSPLDIDIEFQADSSIEHNQKHVSTVSTKTSKDYSDLFKFSTVFSNDNISKLNDTSYIQDNCYKKYIDIKDETVKELPSEDITVKVDGYCVQVTHQNNGTVLNTEFFDPKLKKFFISNFYKDNKTMKIHDSNIKRSELVYVRDNKIQVVSLKDYSAQKVDRNELIRESKEPTQQLLKNERIVLTKDTSQIIIKLVPYPPKLVTRDFFNVDEKLLKNVFTTWAMFIIPLLVLFMLVDSPKQTERIKKEVVVIYKRKKVINKKPTQLNPSKEIAKVNIAVEAPALEKTSPEPKPSKKKKTKKIAKIKKVHKKKIAKVSPKKNKKITKKARTKKKILKVTKAIVKKTNKPTIATVVKKSYKFSSSSLMSAALGKSNTEFKKVKDISVDATTAIGSSNRISKNYDSKKFGTSSNNIARFAAGSPTGKKGTSGTKGLSGKKSATTAYVEANTKILGAMDPELIRKLMREHIPDFRYCYQRELMLNSTVAGVFDIKFKINSAGKGTRVIVKNNGKAFSSNAKNCIKRVVSLINFPRPKGGGSVDVKQPMNFSNL
jgi:hypothetical protein